MDLHLILDGSGSLQSQLLRALRAAIVAGRVAGSSALPPTRRLAHALGVSRNTVLLVYEQLTAEGYIRPRRGAGSYVEPVAALCTIPPAGAVAARAAPRVSNYAKRLSEPHAAADASEGLRFDLGTGVAAVAPALASAWRRALIRAADDTAFDYPPAAGLHQLQRALAGYLARRRGIEADPGNILIVTGIQQGIDLAARILLDPGDLAAVEEPGYGGLRHSLRAHGADVVLVDVDAEGLRVDALQRRPSARLVAVTPSHQFPTGAEMSLARRAALLEWAERHQAYVLEDDYDGEFRHGRRPLPALKSLDRSERVIYLGSLSRALFPAVRLGYLVVPAALRDYFIRAKRLADRGSPAIEQRALADLIDSGRFERLLLATARRLDERRTALIDAIDQFFGDNASVTGGSAGMHLCLHFSDVSASQEAQLIAAAADAEVRIEGMNGYHERPPDRLAVLLSYAQSTPQELREAVRRLAQVVRDLRS